MTASPPTIRPTPSRWIRTALAAGLLAASLAPGAAHAFCGFYVSGGTANLFNDATQVVLMRDGTKTILSMQNNYQGPPTDFAMVVPVPVVLQGANVKTLPASLFAKIDTLSAPRLVEYWEQDPCLEYGDEDDGAGPVRGVPEAAGSPSTDGSDPPKVKVEAQFEVGEYQIVVLSATEATALESWLTTNKYNIPTGAAPIFSQYIQQGQYFFVAKVDPKKVTFKEGRAVLSPLRFDYTSDSFSLPVRMGMVNSSGAQDLIVYILSREGRFEVANYPNVTIPTNIEVSQDVRKDFPTFFTKLFEATLAKTPNAVVTEYAWDAATCDPCPGPTLEGDDYATLGADVLGNLEDFGGWGGGWTLTRLHARYGKTGPSEDLVFKKAPAIVGGREAYQEDDKLETGATPSPASFDNFQGRYIMRNRWKGPVTCSNPRFGRWGGPPNESQPPPSASLSPNSSGRSADVAAASELAPRSLASLVKEPIVELDVMPQASAKTGGSGCSFSAGAAATGSALPLAAAFLLLWRRRRR